jgi:predicted metal-binding protein
MSVTLTVCTSCKTAASNAPGDETRSAGSILAERIETAMLQRHAEGIELVRHECLWACAQACSVLIEGRPRTGYLAGRFEPTEAAAGAILDWASAYAATPDGVVPYRNWPEGIKGHFIARIPARKEEQS